VTGRRHGCMVVGQIPGLVLRRGKDLRCEAWETCNGRENGIDTGTRNQHHQRTQTGIRSRSSCPRTQSQPRHSQGAVAAVLLFICSGCDNDLDDGGRRDPSGHNRDWRQRQATESLGNMLVILDSRPRASRSPWLRGSTSELCLFVGTASGCARGA
jgi:hypothetical protein